MLKTRDCVVALIEWSTVNYDSLATPDYWDFVGEKRMAALSKGHTRVGNWKRRAIKKNGDATYRLFDSNQSLFPLGMQFLVVEENGVVTDIIAGETSDFVSYFNKIGYNWEGWA
jgi:hypothetical protein